jgi:hypothetical protein
VAAESGGGGSSGSVVARCPARGLLDVAVGHAHTPNNTPGPYASADDEEDT